MSKACVTYNRFLRMIFLLIPSLPTASLPPCLSLSLYFYIQLCLYLYLSLPLTAPGMCPGLLNTHFKVREIPYMYEALKIAK